MKHFKHVSAKRLTWMTVICAFLIFVTTHQGFPRAQAFNWPAPIDRHHQHRVEQTPDTENSADPDVTGFLEEESVSADTPGSTDKHESTGDEILLVPAR